MARTALTPIDAPASYATGGAALTWTAADPTNKNEVILTGREILLARNDDAAAQTVTVHSVGDPYSRTGDASREIAAGEYGVFQMFPTCGWQQSNGKLNIDAASANVKFAVLRLP